MTTYQHFKMVPTRKWRWPSFSPSEVGCRHCGWIRINPDFLDTLQALRDQRGPTTVSNVCRCAVHNARVGGAPGSMHLMGMAADVALLGAARKGLQQAAIAVGFKGFGYYQTFLHVDLGRPRFWGQKELWNA